MDVVIIGAGPAGLACAASMIGRGMKPLVLEKAGAVASSWRQHYDRLHLHTDRGHSGLPGLPMPHSFPRYPSRAQVVNYLESYAARFGINPEFDTAVDRISRSGPGWRVDAGGREIAAKAVVVATGWASFPHEPLWPGMDSFTGTIVHSSRYRNAEGFARMRVLVIGFGNSGGEIALDLAEAGVAVTLSVRGPVQLLPRELLGFPILTWAIAQRRLPARVADFLNAPVLRLALGSMTSLGLEKAAKGPRRMVEEDGRVPLFDIGTLGKIRDGSIKVRKGVGRFKPGGVVFADDSAADFDAVILATGFRPDLRRLIPESVGVLDEQGKPLARGPLTREPGLYICGLIASPTGQLREIGIEAERIADAVKSAAIH